MTEKELLANKSAVVGSEILVSDDFGSEAKGTIIAFNVEQNAYHVAFEDHTEMDLRFQDFVESLPHSKQHYAKEDNDTLFNFAASASAFKASLMRTDCDSASATITEPRTWDDMLKAPDYREWKVATDDEHGKLERKGCWRKFKRADLPQGARIIRSKWVFKVKYKNGKFERRKARIVACGYDQRPGIDFASAFSPTASQVALRFIMGMTAMPGFWSEDYDAESAFISATLPPDEIV